MRLLRDDAALLDAACTRIAGATGIPYAHVEKDYWLTEALRGIASYATAAGFTVIFKGGTSLSKGYGLIHRFSEDVDVLVVFPEISKGQRDRHLKGLVAAAGTATGLEPISDPAKSDTGTKRVATLEYPRRSSVGAGTTPAVLLELHAIGGGTPMTDLTIESLLSKYLAQIDFDEDFSEMESFVVPVVKPCRTLVEKLIILHGAHVASGPESRRRRIATVRHYYDIWALLRSPEVLEDLERADISVIARDVAVYSEIAGLPAVGRPASGFASSPAIRLPPIGEVNLRYESQVLDQLLWPGAERPPLTECIQSVLDHGAAL